MNALSFGHMGDFAGGGGYEAPLGSGPYKVGKVDSGRSITFERDANWWGKDLPVSRGLYNFDHFSIEYFGDTDVARQVLRGGAYDYNREFSATGFSIGYDSPALSDGRLQKAHLATDAPQPAQGFVFNLQNPIFQDRRVRQALAMLWDFEWSNRQMMRDVVLLPDPDSPTIPTLSPALIIIEKSATAAAP